MAAHIGVISADDKRKLDGIEAGAQVNSTVVASQAVNGLMSKDDKKKLDAYSAVSSESGKFMAANGSWATPKDDDSWATEHLTISGGTNGLDVKRSSGATEFTIPIATTVSAGVMSADDKIKLNATAATGHKHAAGDITSGTLAVARGGTGQTTLALARNAMGLGNTTGALPIANGGTGATTAANALTNLGAAAASHNHDTAYASSTHVHAAADITGGTVAIVNGGTGASDTATARTNLGITPANIGAAASNHNHDSVYAAKSHGNHVPTVQTASNKVFLRNDNSWQTVTPANIGAAASSHTHDYAASSHSHATVTSSAAGFMSSADKTKLDGIAAGANAYSHPTTTAATGTPTVNAAPGFGGTFTVNQVSRDTSGHVSAITSRTITIPSAAATTVAAGLMSKDDKIKLNGIAAGAQVNSVTGVKGNSESAYRTGNVNLTAANIGAAASSHTHNYAGSSSAGGAATSATKLATARTISIGGGASGTASFDGSADAKISLGSINAASITSGTLAVARGGTGQTTLALARNAMGLGNTTGAVPIANGGTGATTAANALSNLGAAAASHTHNYAPLSGATFTGNITAPIYRGAWMYAFQSSTAAGTQVKAATKLSNTMPAFSLEANLVFVLYLAASNTAETPKLNVLSTGEMTFKTSGGKDVPAKALVVGRYILLTGGGSPPSNVFILSGPEGYYKALLGV